MGWTPEFVAALESGSLEMRWYLEFVPWRHGDGIGGAFEMSSHEPGSQKRMGPNVSVTGASVEPGSWRYTHGGFSVGVTGELWHVFDRVRLGNLARLLLGFSGWDLDAFQPVAIGTLRQIRGLHPVYTLEFVDVLQSLQVRSTSDPDALALFGALETAPGTAVSTTLTAKYVPGGGTLGITASAGFVRGATQGAVVVDPEDGGSTGEPFYLLYSGSTASTLTGLSPVDKQGTAQECAGPGSVVTACALLEGHPITISRQLLTSTGAGTNGGDDVLPETWGMGVPVEWIDHADMNEFRDVMGSTRELHEWSVIAQDPQETGLEWWAGYLSAAGAWLVTRQGQITARIAQNPHESGPAAVFRWFDPIHTGITITHRDIAEIVEFEAWSAAPAAETSEMLCWFNASHAVDSETYTSAHEGTGPRGSLETSPGVAQTSTDITAVFWGGSAGAPYPSDAPQDVILRTMMWLLRKPERISVVCRGLRLAQLCAGDLVYLTTYLLQGRLSETGGGYDRQPAMITGITVDWTDGSVALDLVISSREVS